MMMGRKNKAGGARCRRHRQGGGGAGVCAPCLRERLSHLTSASASASASLPSVVRGEEEEASSCCSGASTAYSSSSEASSGASSADSGSSSPWGARFQREMVAGCRGGGRLSLLMRHERVLLDGDEVASVVRRMRERRRQARSFWAKLLHATMGGGGGGGKKEGCSMAHSKTLDQERSTTAAAKWILF